MRSPCELKATTPWTKTDAQLHHNFQLLDFRATYRNAQKLRRIHGRIDLVGNLPIGVREILQRTRHLAVLQPFHCLVEGQRHTPDGIVGERRLLVAFRISIVIDVVALVDQRLIQTQSAVWNRVRFLFKPSG